jgi:hypothetical protein
MKKVFYDKETLSKWYEEEGTAKALRDRIEKETGHSHCANTVIRLLRDAGLPILPKGKQKGLYKFNVI